MDGRKCPAAGISPHSACATPNKQNLPRKATFAEAVFWEMVKQSAVFERRLVLH
jgi:hypothetical protein